MILSTFETKGTWRLVGGGLIHVWADRPEFFPTPLDVPFYFHVGYNLGLPYEDQQKYIRDNRISRIFEIVEVFREPYSDVDSSFRGRGFLVARFENVNDALMFKMAVPDPGYAPKFAYQP